MEGQLQQEELENLKEQGDLEGQGEMEEQEVDDEEPSLPGLVCVEYPGVAANADKVVETLGGLDTLAQVTLAPHPSPCTAGLAGLCITVAAGPRERHYSDWLVGTSLQIQRNRAS